MLLLHKSKTCIFRSMFFMKFIYYLEKIDENKLKELDFEISDDILLSLKNNILDAFKKFSTENKNIDDQVFYNKLFPLLRGELER